MLKDGEKGVILQRDKQTYAIAPHIPCGVVEPALLHKIADVAEKYDCAAVKVTSAARIALVGIKEEDVDQIWRELGMNPGHAVGLCVRSLKVCPGTQFCRLGKQDSLGLGMKLDDRYHGMQLPSKTKVGISGCNNQCAENCIKDIGLVGTKEGWTVTLGGIGTGKPRLADVLAENLSEEDATTLIDRIIDYYKANAKKFERIGRMIDRIGLDTMRKALLD